MNWYMKLGSFIMSLGWFNNLLVFLGLDLFISFSRNMELERRCLKEREFVIKRVVGMCVFIMGYYSYF